MSAEIVLMCLASFGAGFFDAIVGGGGLIQIPALLLLFPQFAPATVLGTNKLISISGTTVAAWQYARGGHVRWSDLRVAVLVAFIGSAMGARLAVYLSAEVMRPLVAVLLIGVWLYTWRRKGLGLTPNVPATRLHPQVVLSLLALVVGMYDGFFGPGTGSFLMFGMTTLLGMDFLQATAHTKVLNWTTNLAALVTFGWQGQVQWVFALPFVAANVLGGWLGSRLAMRCGSPLIRKLFLGVVAAILARLVWDMWR
ncbi:MAG: TSUP family transporter [bacterium]|nr:TSUP family transporter [bacterium]